MSTYWDDAAALVLVAWAGSYLVYRGIQTMRRRTSSGGCGSGCVHCPVKQAAAEVPPVTSSGTLVTLSVPHHLRHL